MYKRQVVNFSSYPSDVKVNIPQLALDMFGIEPGSRQATELISGRHRKKILSSQQPFETEIAPWGAVVWKMK